MRRDSPQASRSRHCRAGRPILSPPDPRLLRRRGSGSFQVPVRARCRVGVRNASSPGRGRGLSCRALGKTDSGADGCACSSEPPGVLLLRRLGPRRAKGRDGAMFGHSGLGMLICRNECVLLTYIYTLHRMLARDGKLSCIQLVIHARAPPAADQFRPRLVRHAEDCGEYS